MIIIICFCILVFVSFSPLLTTIPAWKNGQTADEFSSDPTEPNYGTHDWIAEHALDWLPEIEKGYILKNLDTYLYGTELPDKTNGQDKIGDMDKQHFYFNESGNIKDKSAGIRTAQEYYLAAEYLENGDLYNGILHLGIMTHYIADLAVFGNVMNKTYWGEAKNYSNYMNYVNERMVSYNSNEFNKYLKFDGKLFTLPPEDAAIAVAYNTTFDTIGLDRRSGVPDAGNENCTWMEANYDWSDTIFEARCGESLNYAVNIITDVLHTLHVYNLSYPSKPTKLRVIGVSGHAVNLAWNGITDDTRAGYSIYINQTDETTVFNTTPINVSKDVLTYSYTGLDDEIQYHFKVKAFNYFDKYSDDSNIVSATTLDVTPPPTPTVKNLPSITNDKDISITGKSPEYGSLVEIYQNDFNTPVETNYSDPDLGLYRVELELVLGVNNISIRAVDESGNPSSFSRYQIVIYDPIKPVANAGKNIKLGMKNDPINVTFNGSKSSDNEEIIVNYTWTLEYQYRYYYFYGESPWYIFKNAGDYRIILNVTDQAGNWDLDFVWINITQLDITRPYITFRNLDKDEKNISVNVTIKVKFSEPLNISSLKVRLISNIDGELQIPNPGYDPLRYLTLTPFTNLSYGRIYTIIITGNDLGGNSLKGGIWNFSTKPRPVDFDGDEIPDTWEWQFGLDANKTDANKDPDEDDLTNYEEYNNGRNSTNPQKWDTDGDNMSDYFERIYSLDPLNPSDRNEDLDGDGLTNYEEFLGADGKPDNKDWTDPTKGPEPTDKKKEKKDDDYSIIYIGIIVIIIILLILLLIARKMRYKEAGAEKEEDDDYFKTEDPDELGIGGKILFEDSKGYAEGKDESEPETERSISVDRLSQSRGIGKGQKGLAGKATAEEIMARAKRREKKCPKCNAELPIDTSYCFECGATFEEKSK